MRQALDDDRLGSIPKRGLADIGLADQPIPRSAHHEHGARLRLCRTEPPEAHQLEDGQRTLVAELLGEPPELVLGNAIVEQAVAENLGVRIAHARIHHSRQLEPQPWAVPEHSLCRHQHAGRRNRGEKRSPRKAQA